MKMKNIFFAYLWGIFLIFSASAEEVVLDKSLAPQEDSGYANVFRDMGVVQKRAMKKSGKFLISNYAGLDFSDGPYTMYSLNVNPGYALSDFWEIYLTSVPLFVSSARGIVTDIESLKLDRTEYPDVCPATGTCFASVRSVKPKYQFGGELLWAPAYGKDSVGSRRIIRSDTFFKFGVADVFYEGSQTGLKIHTAIGKTYFLDDWMGFRFAATANYIQTVPAIGTSTSAKVFKFFAIVEAGFVIYL